MFIRDLVESLDRHGVPYAVVGGVAVNLHGVPRMTYDIDIVVKTDETTLRDCESALRSIGLAPRIPVRLGDLSSRAERERLEAERNLTAVTFTDPSNPLREVDVLIGPSIDPDGVVDRAAISDTGSFQLRVAALTDLISMKRRAGRPQDLADVAHLERIAARRSS